MKPHDTPKPPEPVVAVLRCTICGKLLKCGQSEVERYMASNDWPRCHDQVMSVTLSGEWPRVRS